MATMFRLKTPIPSPAKVAQNLGIDKERHAEITSLAKESVKGYYSTKAKKSTAKRVKAA